MPLKGREQTEEYKKNNGKTSRNHCINCGKELSGYRAKRCKSCANKVTMEKLWQDPKHREKCKENNHPYKDGRTSIKNYCIDCGREIHYRVKRCQSCNMKLQWRNPQYRENHRSYKDGRSLVKHYCLDCGKELSCHTVKRCQSCDSRKRWQDGIFDGVFQSPTKPEEEIMKILEKLKIDYVFQFRPEGYSKPYDFYIPFINLLIEYDSKYWHRNTQQRDTEKTKYAENNGYNLLRFDENNLDAFENIIRGKNNEIIYV